MDTEDRLERYRLADTWPADESLAAMLDSQMSAYHAVRQALGQLAIAAERAAERLTEQGRLIYAGAGASGRLAVQDGVELVPTFGWPSERLGYVIAGGNAALVRSIEGAEDSTEDGARAVADKMVGEADVLIGVAASGRTPFTLSVVKAARSKGALTIGLSCNQPAPLLSAADVGVPLKTGPEFLAGSTRMIAGTAQKIALNLLSTQIMMQMGRVYDGLMVDVQATNSKLEHRRLRIIQRLTECSEKQAIGALAAVNGDLKLSVLLLDGMEPTEARARLDQERGRLRRIRGR